MNLIRLFFVYALLAGSSLHAASPVIYAAQPISERRIGAGQDHQVYQVSYLVYQPGSSTPLIFYLETDIKVYHVFAAGEVFFTKPFRPGVTLLTTMLAASVTHDTRGYQTSQYVTLTAQSLAKPEGGPAPRQWYGIGRRILHSPLGEPVAVWQTFDFGDFPYLTEQARAREMPEWTDEQRFDNAISFMRTMIEAGGDYTAAQD